MEYKPNKNVEEAIATLLSCRGYVVITVSDLEGQSDGADSQYNIFYSDFMLTKGLLDYATMEWNKHLTDLS